MGCWGVHALQSDDGLDAMITIRGNIPPDGAMDLDDVIWDLVYDADECPPVAMRAPTHSSFMTLAEVMTKFLDGAAAELDYDEVPQRFADVTSFTASKGSLQILRDYLKDTLRYAQAREKQGNKWDGWFEEKGWLGWQSHMESLITGLDGLIMLPCENVQLCQVQAMEQNGGHNAPPLQQTM